MSAQTIVWKLGAFCSISWNAKIYIICSKYFFLSHKDSAYIALRDLAPSYTVISFDWVVNWLSGLDFMIVLFTQQFKNDMQYQYCYKLWNNVLFITE